MRFIVKVTYDVQGSMLDVSAKEVAIKIISRRGSDAIVVYIIRYILA